MAIVIAEKHALFKGAMPKLNQLKFAPEQWMERVSDLKCFRHTWIAKCS